MLKEQISFISSFVDHSCAVWLKLVEWFRYRICETVQLLQDFLSAMAES